MKIKKKASLAIMAMLAVVLAIGVGGYVWKEEHRSKVLEVYVFALKSGRSMFIRTPNDKRILIDGGSNADIIAELTKILPFYSRRIDAIMATNTEGKNVSGLIGALERYKVGKAYLPRFTLKSLNLASSTDQTYQTFLDELDSSGIPVEELAAGQSLDFDEGLNLTVLFPAEPNKFAYSKTSGPELLFDLNYGTTNFYFLGSATPKVQKYIASTTRTSNGLNLLIVSHSALPGNISKELVSEINPSYLVYSKSSSNIASRSSKTPKKPVTDPLAGIASDSKWNIKEAGTAHFILDGIKLSLIR